MLFQVKINHDLFSFDSSQAIDISIPIIAGDQTVNAYYIPFAEITPFKMGTFIGSTAFGGPVNCYDVKFNPHAHGTHTECYGHIAKNHIKLNDCLKEFWFKAKLISVWPTLNPNGDLVIYKENLEGIDWNNEEALIIRTLPNDYTKTKRHYSGTNPAYFDPEFIQKIKEQGIKHLICDLPSIDREEDEGALAAHKCFWNYPENTRLDCTITELAFIPELISDGDYLLNLMVSGFDSDAVPSKPILYKI